MDSLWPLTDIADGRVLISLLSSWSLPPYGAFRVRYFTRIILVALRDTRHRNSIFSSVMRVSSSPSPTPVTIIRQDSNGARLLIRSPSCLLPAKRCNCTLVVDVYIVILSFERLQMLRSSHKQSQSLTDVFIYIYIYIYIYIKVT
jgi:hypothetical protein